MNRRTNTGLEGSGRAAVLVLVLLPALTVCGGAPDQAPAVDGRPPPTGGTIAGLIVRDDGTQSDIETTAGAKLPAHDPAKSPLSLVVTKSRYRIDVLLGERRIKTYPIALGGDSSGAKQLQGDSRTPEGEYVLYPHHPSPSFGGSFYVAYPTESDALQGFEAGRVDADQRDRIVSANRRGNKPPYQTPLGGLILIHGTKKRWVPALTRTNWTDGCIAMENDDLQELLAVFDTVDRPIVRILP